MTLIKQHKEIRELEDLREDIRILEDQLKRRRRDRDKIVAGLANAGKIPIRAIAKLAGISNPRVVQIKREIGRIK